jgi:hypothetical protein
MSWFNGSAGKLPLAGSSSRSGYGAVPTGDDAAPPATAPKPRASSSFDTRARNAGHADHLAQGVGELQFAPAPRQGSAPVSEDPGFTPDRLKLASYLLALDATGYRITSVQKELLRDMTDIQSAAKAMFPLGHPNCPEDVERTGGTNRVLAQAVHDVIMDFFGNKVWGAPKNSKYLMPDFDSVNSTETSRSKFKKLSDRVAHGIYAYFGVMSMFTYHSPWGDIENSRLAPTIATPSSSSKRLEIGSAILYQAEKKQGFISQFNPGGKYFKFEYKDKLLNPKLPANEAAFRFVPMLSVDSSDSAIFRSHSNIDSSRRVVEYFAFESLNSASTFSAKNSSFIDMVEFSHGLNNVAPKLEAAVFSSMTPRKASAARTKAKKYLASVRNNIRGACSAPSYESTVKPDFAHAAARAIDALTTGKATRMAIEIAQYLGASPEEAKVKAPEVIARAKQLNTYQAPSGAAGPA